VSWPIYGVGHEDGWDHSVVEVVGRLKELDRRAEARRRARFYRTHGGLPQPEVGRRAVPEGPADPRAVKTAKQALVRLATRGDAVSADDVGDVVAACRASRAVLLAARAEIPESSPIVDDVISRASLYCAVPFVEEIGEPDDSAYQAWRTQQANKVHWVAISQCCLVALAVLVGWSRGAHGWPFWGLVVSGAALFAYASTRLVLNRRRIDRP
jgi:hypothetical protein